MASTLFFSGRLIGVPGSYTTVDASGLEQVGLGASGIIAVLGTAEGGRPSGTITEVKDLLRFTKPEKVLETFRSGDLLEVGDMLFAPSNDPDVLGGAQQVVAMKVNPATQSSGILTNPQGDAIDLLSSDYGAFTSQINVSIANGTTQGKLITVIFEDVTESADSIGGDNIFTLTYDKTGGGWDTTMTTQVLAGGSVASLGTSDHIGLDADVGTQLAIAGKIEALSDSAADTGVVVAVGLDGTGTPIKEEITLTGVTASQGAVIFTTVLGVYMKSGSNTGIITVRAFGAGATIFTISAAAIDSGAHRKLVMYANGVVTLVSSGASIKDVVLVGLNATGAAVLEKVTLTGVVPVLSIATFSKVQAIILGDVEAAQTITFSGEAARSLGTTHNTVLKSSDYYNGRSDGTGGFTHAIVTGSTGFVMDNLDVQVAAVNSLDPAVPGFKADLWAVLNWINTNSQFIGATRSAGATGGAPDNISNLFLAGGIEGTALFSHYQQALNLLKQARINTIVALTGDPAVHAAVDSHCAYMGGIGRSERDACLGALNAGLTDVPSKDEAKTQAVDLNSRHIRLATQAIERFNRAGERVEFLPPFTAAVAAGMQAGSSVGTSLTYKLANVLGFRQHSTWNPTDDAEEMIQGGLLFMENVEGVGRRWVRNVTTHLSSNNPAFVEASTNEATNFSVYTLRNALEFAVGKKGFAGTINATKGIAINTLGLLVAAQILVQWRSLDITLNVDVLEVGVEIAPIIPINFVATTVHLVTVAQTAA